MANIIQIKHGSNKPTSENLRNYELGFSDTTKKIYINDNNNIRELSSISIKTYISLNTTDTTTTISGLVLTDYCSVFIDLDFSNTDLNENQIKAFRKADLIYSNNTDTELTLKINGKQPAQNFSIPVQITVVY